MSPRRHLWSRLSFVALCSLLTLPATVEAETGYPDGLTFHCDWKFVSGPNSGLTGTSNIQLDLGAGNLQRTGTLVTTYPDGASRSDDVTLDRPQIGKKEKLWRITLPEADISCTMRVQKNALVFDSCSNSLHQTCRRQGTTTQATGQRDLYYFLEEISITDDHEGTPWNKPEIELYRAKLEPCGPACPCGSGELFCQRPNSSTKLIFDGGRHTDAAGRTVTLPDINKKGVVYRPNIPIAPYGYHTHQYIVFLIEDDKDKGELRINDCIRLLECSTTIEIVGGSGFPINVKDCPSGTVSRVLGCALGRGDDQFSRPVHLDVSINPGQSVTVFSLDWQIKYRLDFL